MRQDAFDFVELPPHLFNHGLCGAGHGTHGQTAEEEGRHCTDKHADEHARIHEVDLKIGHEVGHGGRVGIKRLAGHVDEGLPLLHGTHQG